MYRRPSGWRQPLDLTAQLVHRVDDDGRRAGLEERSRPDAPGDRDGDRTAVPGGQDVDLGVTDDDDRSRTRERLDQGRLDRARPAAPLRAHHIIETRPQPEAVELPGERAVVVAEAHGRDVGPPGPDGQE